MIKKYLYLSLWKMATLILILQITVLGGESARKFSQKQFDMLLRCSEHKDVNEWNQWRIDHPNEDIFLEDVILEERNFQGVYLNSGKFIDKKGIEHNFTGNVYLKKTRLNKSYLKEANFEGADLEQAQLTRTNLESSRFTRANLLQASLFRAKIKEAKFENAELKEAGLGQANLNKADLSNANLEKCNLERANLKEANLENANLESANLEYTILDHANLKNAILTNADLKGAHLWATHLTGANLDYANLNGARFVVAFLEGAYLRGANLEDAFFVGTFLQGTNFRASIVNGRTWINTWELDNQTDFREVALGNVRIKSSTKQLLEYNKRRLNWEDWYKNHKWKQWPVRIFWYMSEYGTSTLRVILSFMIIVSFFSILYYFFGLMGLDIVDNLFEYQGQRYKKGLRFEILIRSIYFSIVTMTTLGFGDIHANRNSFTGQFIVIIQVICGYLLLGALITRLGILFMAGGPAG
jgi:uncharacterized protein YjbI with pentapeptide repeats